MASVQGAARPTPAAELRSGERTRRILAGSVLLAALLATVLAILPLDGWLRSAALLALTVALPGVLLAALLAPQALTWLDRWAFGLYSLGAGYATAILLGWGLSVLPGGLAGWQVLAAANALIVALGVGVLVRPAPAPVTVQTGAPMDRSVARWALAGVASVVLVALLLRLPNLGYSDFQGDEARAMLRAADVIQGYDAALLIHKKGPAEIVLPALLYAPLGSIAEGYARLPFALANLGGILAIYLLGWRMFGPLAGWVAAMLLAVDGYFIGFARIVQYQSVVFLTTALVVLALYAQYRARRAVGGYLWLAALFFVAGLLSHYEALWAVIPGGYLLYALARQGESPRRMLAALGPPLLAAGVMLALFYVPFMLDARFARTADDIFGNRIGSRFPYNNLQDFVLRTTVYSAGYYLLLLIGVTVAALAAIYRRNWPAWAAWLATGLVVAGLAASVVRPGWLLLGGRDQTWLFYAVAVGVVWVLPRVSAEERTVWLWFGVPMVLSLFFVAKPNSHVYGFFSGWVLIVGATLDQGWQALARRAGRGIARWLAVPAAAALVLIFGNYAYWFFVYHGVEVLRTWQDNRPAGYWTPYALPTSHSLFGFPYKNGWKVVGALYADGTLDAPFDTNETSRVADWYGRGLDYCPPDSAYYMVAGSLAPDSQIEDEALIAELTQRGYAEFGRVEVEGNPRLRIFTTRPVSGTVRVFDEADYAPRFDRQMAGPEFLKLGPVAGGMLPADDGLQTTPLALRLGDIRLRGYGLERTTLAPGDPLHLRLYWEATTPIDREYKVFVQLIDLATLHKAAQRDGEPGCTKYATDEWRAGELNLDPYHLTVAADTPPGEYTLLVGMYDPETLERLPVYDEAGAQIGDAVPLHTIQVVAP